MAVYTDFNKNISIEANDLQIGKNVSFGRDIHIKVRGKFHLGDHSHLGDHVSMKGENIIIGKHFYYSPLNNLGLVVGGGGNNSPNANLTVGDRCVFHNSLINICEPVTIGDDVGLSNYVDIISHGFWYSVLQGYPAQFNGVNIGNNVIIGWRSTIMMGVDIADNTVIGSQSNVVKSLKQSNAVYVGNPAKLVKQIEEPDVVTKYTMLTSILDDLKELLDHYNVTIPIVRINYPYVHITDTKLHADFVFNVDDFTYKGTESDLTDAIRDFLRKRGIRIYTKRPFAFKLERK